MGFDAIKHYSATTEGRRWVDNRPVARFTRHGQFVEMLSIMLLDNLYSAQTDAIGTERAEEN